MRVKIKPDAHLNHRPPHIPWYIKDDLTGVIDSALSVTYMVNDWSDDSYVISGIYYPGVGLMPSHKPPLTFIYKKDADYVSTKIPHDQHPPTEATP